MNPRFFFPPFLMHTFRTFSTISANKAGLQQKDVLEILELTNTASTLMLEKGNGEYGFWLFNLSYFFFQQRKTFIS